MKRKLNNCTLQTILNAIFFCTLLLITNQSQAQVNQKDSLFLVAMYIAYDGENWTHNDNWLSGTVDTWYGITLNADGTRVTKLELPENDITARFPEKIDDQNYIIDFITNVLKLGIDQTIKLVDTMLELYTMDGISLG
ncbi:MAG: hypothetical protein JW735_08085, partial [Prolixibacteraceae bacterium]|nr:hypothetical protein [Prolixibacteraceae bacterium]